MYNVVVAFCGTMRDPGKFYSSQEVYDAYYSLQLIQFTLELVLAIVPNLGIEAVTLYGIYRIIKGNCTTASRILRVTSAAVSVVAVIGFWLGKIFARAVSMNVEIKASHHDGCAELCGKWCYPVYLMEYTFHSGCHSSCLQDARAHGGCREA